MVANEEANENVIVKMTESFTEQAGQVLYRSFWLISAKTEALTDRSRAVTATAKVRLFMTLV